MLVFCLTGVVPGLVTSNMYYRHHWMRSCLDVQHQLQKKCDRRLYHLLTVLKILEQCQDHLHPVFHFRQWCDEHFPLIIPLFKIRTMIS